MERNNCWGCGWIIAEEALKAFGWKIGILGHSTFQSSILSRWSQVVQYFVELPELQGRTAGRIPNRSKILSSQSGCGDWIGYHSLAGACIFWLMGCVSVTMITSQCHFVWSSNDDWSLAVMIELEPVDLVVGASHFTTQEKIFFVLLGGVRGDLGGRCWFGWALWLSAIRTVKLLVVDHRFCRAKPSNEESRAKPSYETQRVDEGCKVGRWRQEMWLLWTSFCGANITFQAAIGFHFLDNGRLFCFKQNSRLLSNVRPRGWTKTSFCGANITFQAVIRSHFLDNRRLWYFPWSTKFACCPRSETQRVERRLQSWECWAISWRWGLTSSTTADCGAFLGDDCRRSATTAEFESWNRNSWQQLLLQSWLLCCWQRAKGKADGCRRWSIWRKG